MNDLLAILIALVTGAAMSVAISCVWVVLLLPARLQGLLKAASPRSLTIALCAGLIFAAMHNALGLSLHLPVLFGSAALLIGGMFVGMLASALGEILEVAPVMMRRFRLGDVSPGMRLALLVGKGLGAVLATLAISL